jgi:hypothetical protein
VTAHRRKCGTGIWPDRDIAAGWSDIGVPCGSLPTAPKTQPGNPRGNPGFLTHEDKVPRETDSPLEGDGFEPSVPRVMDGDLGGQVPALIAVFELAGTAVALQRGTKVVWPHRHPEFP